MNKLLKALKEGKVNRDTICETIMTFKSGPDVLLEAARANKNSHHVLRSIISAWKSIDLDTPVAETVIREVIEESRHPVKEIRKTCVETLSAMEANLTPLQRIQSPYLRPSNLAYTLYAFLHDPCPEVRKATREALISLGHFGRFVMIEGLRKEKQVTTRAECVSGLGTFGVLSIRPIIIALADPEEKVWQ